MKQSMVYPFIVPRSLLLAAMLFLIQGSGYVQSAASSARDAAPLDLTGYWISVITEDWMYRMVTPATGKFGAIPLNATGRQQAVQWDPAADEAAGELCKAYGAPAIMRMPGRLHATWENDNTLRVDVDTGMQTRLFHFGPNGTRAGEIDSLQGNSLAQWQAQGNLKVETSGFRPGYLLKNGIPYSAGATLTEYYDRITTPGGDEWLMVTIIVEDMLYLNSPYVTSVQYRRLPDAEGWNPTPCSAR